MSNEHYERERAVCHQPVNHPAFRHRGADPSASRDRIFYVKSTVDRLLVTAFCVAIVDDGYLFSIIAHPYPLPSYSFFSRMRAHLTEYYHSFQYVAWLGWDASNELSNIGRVPFRRTVDNPALPRPSYSRTLWPVSHSAFTTRRHHSHGRLCQRSFDGSSVHSLITLLIELHVYTVQPTILTLSL